MVTSVPRLGLALAALLAVLPSAPLTAQAAGAERVGGEVFTGGELESYLRLLQTLGKSTPYPWSLRGFSPGDAG